MFDFFFELEFLLHTYINNFTFFWQCWNRSYSLVYFWFWHWKFEKDFFFRPGGVLPDFLFFFPAGSCPIFLPDSILLICSWTVLFSGCRICAAVYILLISSQRDLSRVEWQICPRGIYIYISGFGVYTTNICLLVRIFMLPKLCFRTLNGCS